MNIFDSLRRASIHFPGKEAIVFKGARISYADLYAQVCRLSAALAERFKLSKGDRVALFLPNVPEFVVSYYAVERAGAIAVSLNVMLKRDEVDFVLNDAEAKLLITAAPLLEQVPETVPSLKGIVAVGPTVPPGVTSYRDLSSGSAAQIPAANLDRNDGAAILYTSGTTGKPKGVLLTHGNLVSNVYATCHHTRMDPHDRLICYLPLFHCFGQNFIMNACMTAGATLILHERFVIDELLESIRSNRASMFFGVPAVYVRLLGVSGIDESFQPVRYYFSAAAPMPTEVARAWRERFRQPIYEGYGLTETSPFASYNHDFTYRLGSVGTPIENVEMKIVDEQGNELPPQTPGEIAIKGPNVMKGYYNRPDETREVLRHDWFLTGDIGMMDEDGYFYLVDRAKDMINVSGFKVWPREVEEILLQHPAVSEAAVIGVGDAVSGEAVKAFIVLRPQACAREQDVIAFCRSRIAVYKAPRYVEFIDALPKNPAGKILRRELRAREAAKRSPGESRG
ncbi:MAG TPA: long-chain fatty acid--CoA ligase [Candidatus Acidoferrales bacterium]|nr:long-chain fatty acid--CoA ligase [Candidatus Acidoferrales bacterium]